MLFKELMLDFPVKLRLPPYPVSPPKLDNEFFLMLNKRRFPRFGVYFQRTC